MCMIPMQIICCFTVEKKLDELFLQRGILIRDCSNFRGLQRGYYRIAVKSEEQNRIFAEVLREIHGNAQAVEFVLPGEIEGRSFAIITKELEERGIVIPKEQEPVTKRVIHTSADFGYADTLTFSENAVEIAKHLIRTGADIVTDTNMALSGVNKKVLEAHGGMARCFMADEEVAGEAKERKVTRAVVSMEHAAKLDKPVIFAIGNRTNGTDPFV